MVSIDALLPAQTTLCRGEPLNVLLIVGNSENEARRVPIRFYGNEGHGWRELYAKDCDLAPKGHSHLYFQLPARCFGEEFWGHAPEELSLVAAQAPPASEQGGVLLFFDAPKAADAAKTRK